jgi:hypothetical protein
MTFRSGRLTSSLLSGLAFAFLTWLMIGDHPDPIAFGKGFDWLGQAIIILLLPGIIAGFSVSNNIHIADTWVVASGNCLFYFALAYLGATLWQKRGASAQRKQGASLAENR